MADFSPAPRQQPTLVTGVRGPEDALAQRTVVDMKDRILLYMPEATPFTTLTGQVKGARTAHNLKVEWMEKDAKPRSVVVSGAQTDVDTTVTLVTGEQTKLANNDVLRNKRTGELLLVTDASANPVTMVRGIGESPLALNDQDELIIIGTSYPDASRRGTAKSILEYPNFNYTQIFRRSFEFSGRDIVTEFYGGNDVDNETKWQAVEFKRDIEYTAYFGKRELIAQSGSTKQRTFTGGLLQAIKTNVWDLSTPGAPFASRTFNEFLEEAMRWGRGGRLQAGKAIKYLLCGSRYLTEFSSWGEEKLHTVVLDEKIGFVAKSYQSSHGTVIFMASPILDEYHPDYAFLIDFNHVDKVVLRDRGYKLLRGREDNDFDGEAYEYFADLGWEIGFEHAHALIKGISI